MRRGRPSAVWLTDCLATVFTYRCGVRRIVVLTLLVGLVVIPTALSGVDRLGEPARAGPTQPAEALLAARKTHLDWAVRLLRGVRENTTSYRHKNGSVKWKGVDGATRSESHTDCSGLLNFVFKRAYGLSDDALAAWLGTRRPVPKGAH